MIEAVQEISTKIMTAIQSGNLQPVEQFISDKAAFVHMGVCLDKKVNLKQLKKG